MDKQTYLKNWSDKLSISVEEIEQEYNRIFQEEKEIHKGMDEAEQEKRALQRLALVYKKQLRSPAVGFEGIIIGVADCIDIVAKQRREAKTLYEHAPQEAITGGVTDESGTPLDTRESWAGGRANQNFGKPLPENNFLRNIYGIAKKTKGSTEPKFFSMVISGKKAQDDTIPVFDPVRFMGIDRSEEGSNLYKINASTFTNFVNADLTLPDYKTLASQFCEMVAFSELENYHNLNKDDFNRLCVVEGDVSMLNLEPTAFGSRIMSLEDADASLEDLDAKGLTCWLPERININFAEGSKVLVVGRTAQGKKKDEAGNITDELGDVTMNVYGLYALPEYKVSLPEEIQPIAEEDI
ncbi:MAG: hypothetical protein KAQ92_05840 [Candidatus Aenigmarchaeota archaeon]|nr:hypothetical protein [Candidatus Aenigmarchaeota archaeon]